MNILLLQLLMAKQGDNVRLRAPKAWLHMKPGDCLGLLYMFRVA